MTHFKLDEFKCPCCGKNNISQELVDMLDHARTVSDVPYHINSGARCEIHNERVGGSSTSSHLKGIASDIGVRNGEGRFKVLLGLLTAGFTRIGIGHTFIHVDIDKDKLQEIIFLY